MQDLRDSRASSSLQPAKSAAKSSPLSRDQLASTEKLPLFISPERLVFNLHDTQTHKRILTVFNPYNFPIKFRILCTDPRNYHVGESKGIIQQKRCSDIVIRRREFSPDTLASIDKFRIQVFFADKSSTSAASSSSSSKQSNNWKLLGVREVQASVVSTPSAKTSPSAPADQEPSGPRKLLDFTSGDTFSPALQEPSQREPSVGFCSEKLIVVLAALVCLAAISLPTVGERDPDSILPSYFVLTVYQKNVICYFLGLLTWAVFK